MRTTPRRLAPSLFLALASACGETSDADPPGPAPVLPAAQPTPAPPSAGQSAGAPTAAPLLAAFDASLAAPHRIRATMTGGPAGVPGAFTVEVQSADRMRMVMPMPGGREMQIVTIGEQTWTNAMDGRFRRMPGTPGMGGAQASATARVRAALSDGRARFGPGAPDTLDGQPMTVWEGSGPMDLGAGLPGGPTPDAPTSTSRIWIGADGRIHRVVSRVERDGVEIDLRYEYDPSIRVDAPPDA